MDLTVNQLIIFTNVRIYVFEFTKSPCMSRAYIRGMPSDCDIIDMARLVG